MKIIEEFKKFAIKGNVMDLAVAVVVGGAFGKIVTSLVNDIIMPLVGVLTGGINYSSLALTFGDVRKVTIAYGSFLQSVVDFLIIASAIFFVIKQMDLFKKKEEEQPKEEPAPSREELLLMEIRDALVKKK